ncbi:hypothetical protein [Nostoc sp.]
MLRQRTLNKRRSEDQLLVDVDNQLLNVREENLLWDKVKLL